MEKEFHIKENPKDVILAPVGKEIVVSSSHIYDE
jgi:hypothetical protein